MRRLLFRLLAAAPATDHVSDAELLHRFVAANDPAAFELIVRRHADAVWATCRRMLACDANAEDAFQATFLALIRKAKAVRTPCVAGWLHRVATNAALKLLANRDRQGAGGLEEYPLPDGRGSPDVAAESFELAAAVHEELARLSERERLPVVLCDLEGLSHADAATALGWPVGTVSGRLSRARAKLRERLARRGLAPSAALIPALAAPPHLIPTALALTAGAASPAVVSLTEGVLSAMRTAKLKLATAVLAAAGLVVLVGLGTVFALAPAANPPAAQRPVGELADGDAPPEPDDKPKVDRKWRERPFPSAYPDIPALDVKFLTEFEKKHVEPIYEADPPLRKLQKAKLRVALDRIDRTLHGIDRYLTDPPKHGPHNLLFSTVEPLSAQTREAVAVALDLSTGAEARRPWLVLRVAAEKRVEGVIESFGSKLGFGRMDNDVPRLDAEIELAKFDKAK